MDKSMTGDGAVVREWNSRSVGEDSGIVMAATMVAEHNGVVALARQQAAEIERLNSAVRSRNGEVRNLSEMLANEATRGDVAEASTADLLKALEMYGRHLNGECKKWEPRSTAANAHWYFNDAMPCTCGLAAAKGETV